MGGLVGGGVGGVTTNHRRRPSLKVIVQGRKMYFFLFSLKWSCFRWMFHLFIYLCSLHLTRSVGRDSVLMA